MIQEKIFKMWDVRGKYPEEINDDVIRELIKVYVFMFKPTEVIVGHDTLDGSKSLYPVVVEELNKYGVSVLLAGEVSSPMVYFSSGYYKIDKALMLTASHFGPGHTGLKILNDGIPPKPHEIIEYKNNVVDNLVKLTYASPKSWGSKKELTDLKKDYLKKMKDIIGDVKNSSRYLALIDSNNGPNGHVVDNAFNQFGFKFLVINKQIKGTSLAHDSNPKIEKNREGLKNGVIKAKADLGIIWDGDCDRAYFVDRAGNAISPEFCIIQIASYLINRRFGNTITTDVRAAHAVEDEIEKIGGKVKRIEAWHIPIKIEMVSNSDIAYGSETSGHYVFRDMYRSDDGLFASLIFLAAISESEKSLDEMLGEFKNKYKIIEEINFETSKKEVELVNELKNVYHDAKILDIDGITIEYPDWRFNVRASRTEPIIRLNISGTNFAKVDENLEILKGYIGGKILD